jgi:AcrR family transcriptional regulator
MRTEEPSTAVRPRESRKQREVREREQQILQLARPMLGERGLTGLSMERLAAALETAKGTIYNHFPNKEEIVLALAVQAVEQRHQLFDYAARRAGTNRDRMASIGFACEYFVSRSRDLFIAEQMVRNDAVRLKTSEQRRQLLSACEARCMGILGGIIRAAEAAGECKLPDGLNADQLSFGLWAMVHGGMMLELTSPSLAAVGVRDVVSTILRHCGALLDGYGWRPFHDDAQHARMRAECWSEFSRLSIGDPDSTEHVSNSAAVAVSPGRSLAARKAAADAGARR